MELMRWLTRRRGALVALVILCGVSAAHARIKLTTLPVRERVEVQLDNPAATLVEEERIVTLLTGANQVDFSWANTHILKGTIQFRVVNMPARDAAAGDHPSIVRPDGKVETIRVLNVAYPPGENSLVWEVYTEKAFAARVRISYIISNLSRSFDYRAIVEHDESTLTLKKYIRLNNFSGEGFGASGIWAGFGNFFERRIGLNEAKRMLSWKFVNVPVEKIYTFDWYNGAHVPDEPDQRYVAMRYRLENDAEHNMGLFPLQNGKVRIFQKDGRGGEAFIGEDWGSFTPIDSPMELRLGLARDVVVRRKIKTNTRRGVAGNVYNQDVTIEYSIENFKSDAVTLDITEDLDRLRNELCGAKDHHAEWVIVPQGTTLPIDQVERKNAHTVELHIPLEAAPKGDLEVKKLTATVHLILRNEW